MAMMFREGAENRFELVAFLVLIGAFVLAKGARSPMAAYLAVFLAGLIFSKYAWDQRRGKKSLLPVAMVVAAFFVGFIYGGPVGNKGVQFFLLLIGMYLGFEVHKREYGTWVH